MRICGFGGGGGGILYHNTRTCEDLNERICNYSGAQINLQSPL